MAEKQLVRVFIGSSYITLFLKYVTIGKAIIYSKYRIVQERILQLELIMENHGRKIVNKAIIPITTEIEKYK